VEDEEATEDLDRDALEALLEEFDLADTAGETCCDTWALPSAGRVVAMDRGVAPTFPESDRDKPPSLGVAPPSGGSTAYAAALGVLLVEVSMEGGRAARAEDIGPSIGAAGGVAGISTDIAAACAASPAGAGRSTPSSVKPAPATSGSGSS